MDNIILEKQLINTFSELSPDCIAIYRGGSRVDPVIDHPHDYDYICFAAPLHRHFLLNKLYKLGFRKIASNNKCVSKGDNIVDLSQTRVSPYSRITWFSYLDVLMQKVVGEDVCPQTDIIYEHRQEFFNCIYEKMNLLLDNTIKNQKRWYHLLRGIYILINNSYEVSPEQKLEINILHDLADGWEEIKNKTIQLIQDFKLKNNY